MLLIIGFIVVLGSVADGFRLEGGRTSIVVQN
jgi:flagellar motor component MotA